MADANNDGEEDIITANEADDTVSILLWNVSRGVSGDWDAERTETVGGDPYAVYVVDVNNDGENDIVTTNNLDGEVSILLWDLASDDWGTEINKSVGTNPFGVSVADANNDGQNDIVTANNGHNNVSIFTEMFGYKYDPSSPADRYKMREKFKEIFRDDLLIGTSGDILKEIEMVYNPINKL